MTVYPFVSIHLLKHVLLHSRLLSWACEPSDPLSPSLSSALCHGVAGPLHAELLGSQLGLSNARCAWETGAGRGEGLCVSLVVLPLVLSGARLQSGDPRSLV